MPRTISLFLTLSARIHICSLFWFWEEHLLHKCLTKNIELIVKYEINILNKLQVLIILVTAFLEIMMMEEAAQGGDPMYDSDDETADVQSGLILIPDVISHVCKFLGISDIKKCRLICKSWNDGATTVLKVRSIIAIQLHAENYTEGDPFKGEEEDKLKFGPVNLHIKISYKYSPEEYTIPRIDPKIYDAVGKLKYFFVQFITEHELQWQKDFCRKIVLKSAPILEKLKFQWDTYHDFPALRPLVFPKLKELVIFYGRLARFKSSERMGHSITEAFPALEHLEIDTRNLYELSKIEMLPRFPLSLSSLKLSGNLGAEGLESLLKIPGALKRLVFGPISLVTMVQTAHELPPILHRFLQKHSLTLETLEIVLSWEYDDPSDESDHRQPTLQWQFPVFPVLKSLEICTSYVCRTRI
ncbi:uncharacterized protein LOC118435837 [Folsomia candida]|uniref:uncharacterized protein LOC118435837 n=1 Tax=Folsomia candida TaxID=158441 RepID=UPI001604D9BE|nr:uncharacterized protein LOC118435837 [Folsomia candida]XP_035708186.1 uncharacterized protein LOC118435837 [Folsomia candida]